MLIAARAVQGLGGAVIAPASLSILTTTFREGAERNRAVGIWGAMGGAGGAAGVLLGGVLTETLGWRWILFINVPIALGAALFTYRLVAEGRDTSRARNFDLPGASERDARALAARAGDRPHRQHRLGLAADARSDRARSGAARRIRGDRGPLRALAADAAADLLARAR